MIVRVKVVHVEPGFEVVMKREGERTQRSSLAHKANDKNENKNIPITR